ncbi:hypothetical protein LTR84_008079 [Exophiala bonariae]|uniref:Zn(2)-C6 fungal-type domain-containing protein n=1 Tax=Exophiala bonariae TaxID=1690606 RepID=A0AAV9NQM6_9EURO|nr:hypothetical protein LTR84_008079 [Exophiala bonariae]
MARKREPRACDICRSRKVRCDVSIVGSPCSNCSKASAICSLNSAWGKPPAEQSKSTVPSANIHTFKVDVPKAHNSTGDGAFNTVGVIARQEPSEDAHPNAVGDQSKDVQAADSTVSQEHLELPDYITPLPQNIDRHTIQLLRQTGALSVPTNELVSELLRAFTCYVYPSLPVVDLLGCLESVKVRNDNTVSLLLFQAIMMSGAAFADIRVLQRAGFQTHKEAQSALFRRVKLLYEMDIESSPTTIIQALLLMSHWEGQVNDTKGRFYWQGVALSFAIGIGLDNPQYYSGQPGQHQFRQRLWACCVTRTHLLPLLERRPISVKSPDQDIEGLRPHISDINGLAYAFDHYGLREGREESKILEELFIQKLKLGVIIRSIFDLQYERGALRQIDVNDGFMVLLPKSTATGVDMLVLDRQLNNWYKSSSSCKDLAFGQDHRRNGPVVGVHTAVAEMLYLTALSTVHFPQLLADQDVGSADEALQKFSRLTLRSAARRITDIGTSLADSQLVALLPCEAVEAFLVASIQHIRDMMTTETDLRNIESLYLRQTLQILAKLEGKYSSATSAIGFIKWFKNGDFLRQPAGLEDRVFLMTRWGHDLSISHTREKEGSAAPKAISQGKSNLYSETRPVAVAHDATFQTTFDSDGFLTRPHDPVPNLEGYSEILLTTMDWSEVDTATSGGQIL